MNFMKGNMWDVYNDSDLFLITANSFVRQDGELVMGRGIALEAKRRYPMLPQQAGGWLTKNRLNGKFYGVLVGNKELSMLPSVPIGLFQVKYHFADPASLLLIAKSCEMLANIIAKRFTRKINMNFPGIGFGRLSREAVLPTLEKHLADSPVTIWEKETDG